MYKGCRIKLSQKCNENNKEEDTMNTNKLKGKLVEEGMTQEELSLELGISLQSLNAKLNGRAPLTIEEAKRITEILKIDNPSEIFFAPSVPKTQHYRQSKDKN